MPLKGAPSPGREGGPEITDPQTHWRKTRGLTWVLLVLWFIAGFVLPYFAHDVHFSFFGWPFSFWVAAQGAPIAFGLLIAGYAWVMTRLDREHGHDDDD